MEIINQQPFLLYPVNKAVDNAYSYFNSNPIITFEWNEQFSRIIDPKSLRLNGKFRIFNNNSSNGAVRTNQSPANRYDLPGSVAPQGENEYVCYLDSRVSVSSIIQSVTVKNLKGNLFEQMSNYNRNLSSQMAVTASYKDLCSLYQQTFGSEPNNDCIARSCSGDIPVALSMKSGFLQSPKPLLLSNGGLSISVNLASTPSVVYGLNADQFQYELRDVFITGKYLVLAKPIKPAKSIMEYSAYYNFLNILNSGNDHANLNLNLSRCSQIYQNFIPSAWSNNSSFNSLSTPPLLENDAGKYSEVEMESVTFNRGAVRFPYNYDLSFKKANNAGGFQALRSRTFLNSIMSFSKNINTSISPHTENILSMVAPQSTTYPLVLETKQHADQGLINRWVYTSDGNWSREFGVPESSGNVFGVGLKLDDLNIGESQNYSQSSFNYSIKSELNTTANNSNIYVLADTVVYSNASGGLIAQN
tara:strand:+ start:246 stop:1667 length:1422 start_codon:yes stop_codon:yes gene_type:complete